MLSLLRKRHQRPVAHQATVISRCMAVMNTSVELNQREHQLRRLLLDVAEHATRLYGQPPSKLRFAGGWVRDKLLGSSSDDIDIAIDNMTGSQFGHLMKLYLEQDGMSNQYNTHSMGTLAAIEANPEKSKHLETVTTKVFGLEIDLVNLRKETYTESSRNPTMEFGTAEEDALRRDSTINSLFYNLSSQTIEDFSGRGLTDLQSGLIKTPLNPLQTFRDDPLRVLRAIRFASRFDFEIDENDIIAMKDQSIKDVLRTKISRERIGVELTKMLKGPNPHKALALIDRLGLYGTIFTDNQNEDFSGLSGQRWHRSYDLLHQIMRSDQSLCETSEVADLRTFKSVLIRDANEKFLAWMLTCFIPWAKFEAASTLKSGKRLPAPASSAAKNGIKADNKICKIIDDAAHSLHSVIMIKDTGLGADERHQAALLSPDEGSSRELHGMAIKDWGSNWRLDVLFALLTEAAGVDNEAMQAPVLGRYAAWLRGLQRLDLLDADKIRPLVNGRKLCEAVGVKDAGPWVKRALDVIVGWQLQHPGVTDAAAAIQEIQLRRLELQIPPRQTSDTIQSST